jgi:hypothetical protein
VTSCIVNSAAIYFMVVKFRITICPPPRRSSPVIGGLRYQAIQTEHGPYIAERTQKAVYIVRCLCLIYVHQYIKEVYNVLQYLWIIKIISNSNDSQMYKYRYNNKLSVKHALAVYGMLFWLTGTCNSWFKKRRSMSEATSLDKKHVPVDFLQNMVFHYSSTGSMQ